MACTNTCTGYSSDAKIHANLNRPSIFLTGIIGLDSGKCDSTIMPSFIIVSSDSLNELSKAADIL